MVTITKYHTNTYLQQFFEVVLLEKQNISTNTIMWYKFVPITFIVKWHCNTTHPARSRSTKSSNFNSKLWLLCCTMLWNCGNNYCSKGHISHYPQSIVFNNTAKEDCESYKISFIWWQTTTFQCAPDSHFPLIRNKTCLYTTIFHPLQWNSIDLKSEEL
jgi:hypothetical protein